MEPSKFSLPHHYLRGRLFKLFADFRGDLDGKMKRLQQQGLGSRKRQAEPLTLKEEETMWPKGLGLTIHKLF